MTRILPLLLALCLLQGCIGGIFDVVVLSGERVVDPADAGLQELVVGARLGVVDGELSTYGERYLAESLAVKFADAQLFKNLNFPVTGKESVVFEIAAASPPQRHKPAAMFQEILCGVTLLLVCLPMEREFTFDLEVRAIHWPVGGQIARYRSTGKTQVTFGLLSRREAEAEAERKAMTAAYNQVINGIKLDRAKYLPGAAP